MAKRKDADPKPPPTRRDKAAEVRRKARLKRDSREEWIIDKLNRGMSVAELATRQGVTLRRMQILVREILARRTPSPPAGYLVLQVNRLNEAMIVAYGSMAGGNLKAVAQVVRIVSEMDRYHGLFPRRARTPGNRRRLAVPAQEPAALAPPPEARRDGKVACNRLKRLNSAMEIDRAPQPERGGSPRRQSRVTCRQSTSAGQPPDRAAAPEFAGRSSAGDQLQPRG